MKVRIYGEVVNRWYEGDDNNSNLVQIEVKYFEYDAETAELVGEGTEDFSPRRWNKEVDARWAYAWDGKKLNKGGKRRFDDKGRIQHRVNERSSVKAMLKTMYQAEELQLRK